MSGAGLGALDVVGADDDVEVAVGKRRDRQRPLDELARRVRGEADRHPRGAHRGAAARARPAAAARPASSSSITSSCSSSISAPPRPGSPSIRSSLAADSTREEPIRSRLWSRREGRAVAREQVHLGARPGVLGVEQQSVVVEHDRLEVAIGHGRARYFGAVRPYAVMGIVNVTPDSFSDGGRFLDPDAAVEHGLAAGGGGRRDPRRRRRVDPPRRRARARSPTSCDARRPGGRAARRRPATASRSTRPSARSPRRRSRPGATLVNDVSAFRFAPELAGVVADAGAALLPRPHARRAAHDAGAGALRRRGGRGHGVPRGAAGVRRRRRASPRSASGSTRASASARPWTTTWSCCGAWTRSSRSAGRS